MSEYIVAVARDRRASAPSDWKVRVREVKGVKIKRETPARLIIDASPPSIRQVREQVGIWCRIEPVIAHELLS